jgi:predicted ATPase
LNIPDPNFVSGIELVRDRVPTFDHYPFSLAAIKALHILPFHPSVTFFVGENGSGKSTLLEAIALGLGMNPEGGSKNLNFETRPTHSTLGDFLRVRRTHKKPRDHWFLRAESFYNVATNLEKVGQIGYGPRRLHEQSHGESFFALFSNRFSGNGLYLLDEPEAALSPMRQLAFLCLLNDLVREGSQFIIATHSPIIMAFPDSWIYTFGGNEIERTPFEETEHYRVTRGFLNNPKELLKELFEGNRDTLF